MVDIANKEDKDNKKVTIYLTTPLDYALSAVDGKMPLETRGIFIAEGTWNGKFFSEKSIKPLIASNIKNIPILIEHGHTKFKNKVVGKVKDVAWNDILKGVIGRIEVDDPIAIEMIRNKELRGYSMRGAVDYMEDDITKIDTVDLLEISLVADPACSGSQIMLSKDLLDKADGKSSETVSEDAELSGLATVDTPWGVTVAEQNELPDSAFAWIDPAYGKTSDDKSLRKLPYKKKVNGELKVVWRGVAAAMGALLGARGGVSIPSKDKKAVYNLLSRQYKKFGKEPPEANLSLDVALGLEETDKEIRARLVSPSKFDSDSFRRDTLKGVQGTSAIYACSKGHWKENKCDIGMEMQALRFSKDEGWTIEKAKKWLEDHDMTVVMSSEGEDKPIESYPEMEHLSNTPEIPVVESDVVSRLKSIENMINKVLSKLNINLSLDKIETPVESKPQTETIEVKQEEIKPDNVVKMETEVKTMPTEVEKPKEEPKPEVKAAPVVGTVIEPTAGNTIPEPKVEQPKPEVKPEPKIEPKVEEVKPIVKEIPKVETPKVEVKPEPKVEDVKQVVPEPKKPEIDYSKLTSAELLVLLDKRRRK